jgi:hypothetical protein
MLVAPFLGKAMRKGSLKHRAKIGSPTAFELGSWPGGFAAPKTLTFQIIFNETPAGAR